MLCEGFEQRISTFCFLYLRLNPRELLRRRLAQWRLDLRRPATCLQCRQRASRPTGAKPRCRRIRGSSRFLPLLLPGRQNQRNASLCSRQWTVEHWRFVALCETEPPKLSLGDRLRATCRCLHALRRRAAPYRHDHARQRPVGRMAEHSYLASEGATCACFRTARSFFFSAFLPIFSFPALPSAHRKTPSGQCPVPKTPQDRCSGRQMHRASLAARDVLLASTRSRCTPNQTRTHPIPTRPIWSEVKAFFNPTDEDVRRAKEAVCATQFSAATLLPTCICGYHQPRRLNRTGALCARPIARSTTARSGRLFSPSTLHWSN
jgi:hypothetical protein